MAHFVFVKNSMELSPLWNYGMWWLMLNVAAVYRVFQGDL